MNLRKSVIALASMALLHAVAIYAQEPHAVVLPESAVKQLSSCSRPTPKPEGAWTPSESIVATMESHLDEITNLQSKGNQESGQAIHPRTAYRQYLGIIIQGQRYVYINAACARLSADWQHRFLDVCDGGACFWGVLYNVQTGHFSDLQTNGLA